MATLHIPETFLNALPRHPHFGQVLCCECSAPLMQGLKGMAQVKAEITDSRAKARSFQSPNPAYSLTLFFKKKKLKCSETHVAFDFGLAQG